MASGGAGFRLFSAVRELHHHLLMRFHLLRKWRHHPKVGVELAILLSRVSAHVVAFHLGQTTSKHFGA